MSRDAVCQEALFLRAGVGRFGPSSLIFGLQDSGVKRGARTASPPLDPLRRVSGVGLRSHPESSPMDPFQAQNLVQYLRSLARLRLCLGFRMRTHFLDQPLSPILGLCMGSNGEAPKMRPLFRFIVGGPLSESLWLSGLKGLVLASSCARRLPVVFRLVSSPTSPATRCCRTRHTQLCEAL